MIKVNLLKSAIVAKNMTQEEFCKKIGMSHSTFIRKMKKGVVNTNEAEKRIKILDIKNP